MYGEILRRSGGLRAGLEVGWPVQCPWGSGGRQAGKTPQREIMKGLLCQAKKCDLYPEGRGQPQKDFLSARVIRSETCFRKIILVAITHSK